MNRRQFLGTTATGLAALLVPQKAGNSVSPPLVFSLRHPETDVSVRAGHAELLALLAEIKPQAIVDERYDADLHTMYATLIQEPDDGIVRDRLNRQLPVLGAGLVYAVTGEIPYGPLSALDAAIAHHKRVAAIGRVPRSADYHTVLGKQQHVPRRQS